MYVESTGKCRANCRANKQVQLLSRMFKMFVKFMLWCFKIEFFLGLLLIFFLIRSIYLSVSLPMSVSFRDVLPYQLVVPHRLPSA